MATVVSAETVRDRLHDWGLGDTKNDNRITWVEIRGIPLHCWNYETFTRIIEGWGKIIALGENGNMFHDEERTQYSSKKNNREKKDGREEGSASVSSSTGRSQSLKSKGGSGEKNDEVDSVNVKNLGSDATKDNKGELDKKNFMGQESGGPKEMNNSNGHSQQWHNREIDVEVSIEEHSVSEYEEAFLESTKFGSCHSSPWADD
ncbi:hypothetical protein V6N13_132843 [Hibiscus sabdariffa]